MSKSVSGLSLRRKAFKDNAVYEAESDLQSLQVRTYAHHLKTSETALKHHNWVYWCSFIVAVFLALISYLPLAYIVCKVLYALWNGESMAFLEPVGSLASSNGGGILLVALYIAPMMLLRGILRYNSLSDPPTGGDAGDLASLMLKE